MAETGITDKTIYKHIKAGDDSVMPPGFTCSDFMGKTRVGRKIGINNTFLPHTSLVVLGDTYDPTSIIEQGHGCDVLVHESTFLDDRKDALSKGHSTAGIAIQSKNSLL